MYETADFKRSRLSPKCPNPVLQPRQSNPRTAIVLWSWSMCNLVCVAQIAHFPSWVVSRFFNSLNETPWYFARCFKLNVGSRSRRAYRRSLIACLFLWYDWRPNSLPRSLFRAYQLFFSAIRSLCFWCQVRLLAASRLGCGRGNSPLAFRSAYHFLCLASTSIRCSALNLFCHEFLYARLLSAFSIGQLIA